MSPASIKVGAVHTTGPFLVVKSPRQATTVDMTRTGYFSVSGWAFDPSAVSSVEVEVGSVRIPARVRSFGGFLAYWTADVAPTPSMVHDAANSLRVWAIDAHGNSSTARTLRLRLLLPAAEAPLVQPDVLLLDSLGSRITAHDPDAGIIEVSGGALGDIRIGTVLVANPEPPLVPIGVAGRVLALEPHGRGSVRITLGSITLTDVFRRLRLSDFVTSSDTNGVDHPNDAITTSEAEFFSVVLPVSGSFTPFNTGILRVDVDVQSEMRIDGDWWIDTPGWDPANGSWDLTPKITYVSVGGSWDNAVQLTVSSNAAVDLSVFPAKIFEKTFPPINVIVPVGGAPIVIPLVPSISVTHSANISIGGSASRTYDITQSQSAVVSWTPELGLQTGFDPPSLDGHIDTTPLEVELTLGNSLAASAGLAAWAITGPSVTASVGVNVTTVLNDGKHCPELAAKIGGAVGWDVSIPGVSGISLSTELGSIEGVLVESKCPGGPRPPGSPRPGGGNSWGDPHQTTFDGLKYDFHAGGEFVLAKSIDDSFEVQARQGRPGALTRNRAVAMQVGADRLAIYTNRALPDDAPTSTGPISVFRNGSLVTIAQGQTLALEGGWLSRSRDRSGTYQVTWLDGSTVLVAGNGEVLDVYINLAAERAGRVEGLFGDADGDPDNDLIGASGVQVAKADWSAVHTTLAEHWRVGTTSRPSLFDYFGGSATDFAGGYPAEPLTEADFTTEQVTDATEACESTGLEDTEDLAACVIDYLWAMHVSAEPTPPPELAAAFLESAQVRDVIFDDFDRFAVCGEYSGLTGAFVGSSLVVIRYDETEQDLLAVVVDPETGDTISSTVIDADVPTPYTPAGVATDNRLLLTIDGGVVYFDPVTAQVVGTLPNAGVGTTGAGLGLLPVHPGIAVIPGTTGYYQERIGPIGSDHENFAWTDDAGTILGFANRTNAVAVSGAFLNGYYFASTIFANLVAWDIFTGAGNDIRPFPQPSPPDIRTVVGTGVDNELWIAANNDVLYVLDVTGIVPSFGVGSFPPVYLAALQMPGDVRDVAIVGDWAIVTLVDGTVMAIDRLTYRTSLVTYPHLGTLVSEVDDERVLFTGTDGVLRLVCKSAD